MVGGVVADREQRGKGYGKNTMQFLIQQSVSVLGIKKLVLFTDENHRSIAASMYSKMGFNVVGEFGMSFMQN